MPALPINQIVARGGVPEAPTQGQQGAGVAGLVGSVTQLGASIAGYVDRQRDLARQEREAEMRRLDANEADVQIINAQSRLDLKAQERVRELQQRPEGLTGATDLLMKEFDGWVKDEESSVNSLGQPKFASAAARMRGEINQKLAAAETTYRNGKVAADFDTGLEDDRRLVYANPGSFTDALARRRALAQSLSLPDDVRQKLETNAREKLALGAASALAERDPDAFLQRAGIRGGKTGKDGKPVPVDAEAAAKAVKSDPILSNMTPEAMQQVVNRATMLSVQRQAAIDAERERQLRQAEIATAKREREANQAYTILSDWSRNGIIADPVASKPLLDKIAGTPYAAAYSEAAKQIANRNAAAMLPINAQQQQIDALVAQRNAKGTSPALEAEIDSRQQILKATQRAYEDDGLRAALERNIIGPLQPLNTSSVESIAAGLPMRVQQAATAEVQAGRSVSPLTKAEAAGVVGFLRSMPPDQQATALARLASSMPPRQAQALAAQLDPQDKALGLALAAGSAQTTFDRPVSELILRGREALRSKSVKLEDAAETGLTASFDKELGGAISNPEQAQRVREAAKLIWAGKAAEGTRIDPADAVRLAVGGNVLKHNGGKVVVPAGMDESTLQQQLANYPAAALTSQLTDGKVYVRGQAIDAAQFLAALPGAQLRTLARGKFAVVSGGAVVTNARMQPVVVEVGNAR